MSGLVVLEIRDLGGATAEEILDGRVVPTAGDEAAGFYRRRDTTGDREAMSDPEGNEFDIV